MAAVDLVAKTDDVAETARKPETSLVWDLAIGTTALGFGWDPEPVAVDWYGRGRVDLLVSAGGGPKGRSARVYSALGTISGEYWHFNAGEPVPALDGLRCLCPLPNGRDSRFDLVALDEQGLVALENQGSPDRPEFSTRRALGIGADLGIGPCRVVQIVSVDWDGDGSTDLLVGIDDLTDYWPDAGRVPASQQKGFNQKGGHPAYDGAGLWRGRTPRGRLFWLRNVGRPGEPIFELQQELVGDTHPLDLGLHPAPLGVSWARPGSMELVVTDRRGWIHVHRNFGGQRPPILMEPTALRCGGAQFLLPEDRTVIIAADIDGDRRDELIYGTSDGRLFAVHSASGRNDVHNPQLILQERQEVWLGGHAVVTAADIDGDGGLDLVAGDISGRLHVFRHHNGEGGHRYKAGVTLEAGGIPFFLDPGPDGMLDGPAFSRRGYSCPAFADWSGNGRPDLIVGGAGGEVLWLKNDGAPTEPRYASPVRIRCGGQPMITPPRVRPAVIDWSGSGEHDLISLDLQGFLSVYPRAGKQDVGPPVPLIDRLGRFLRLDGGFGQSGLCSIWAGPWCGSGLPDLLVGLPRGNRHVIPALTGLPLNDAETLPTVLLLENLGNNVLSPRPLRYADGSPLILGHDGCSPMGVPGARDGHFDLLVGLDDGTVHRFGRDQLAW